jgi:phosphate ABC transporter phosphate-binding protein
VRRRPALRVAAALAVAMFLALLVVVAAGPAVRPVAADDYVPVSGSGSTWSENAINQWIADVAQYGMRVNYNGDGSSQGRQDFLDGTVDFAASDIPFQSHPTDGSAPEDPAPGTYAYMPITAGGTSFMYNLTINGQRVTNLRLSGENIAKIFTGQITKWNDPAIQVDNPQLDLPDITIVPVVRSDGAGSTAQFVLWMINQYSSIWNAYCNSVGRSGECGETSYYPTSGNMIAQSGDLGVAGYVAANYADGAIGYVEYSYAINARFPVVQMLNAAGYYTEPTADNVAVSLLKAEVDTTDVNDPSLYLTQQLNGVYTDTDPRTYPLSSYSYLILPTAIQGQFTSDKGKTLAAFSYYAMCQGQQESSSLGYSPMPYNLVEDAFGQIAKIPGAVVQNIQIQSCNNPTFSTTSPNELANTAPMPPACAKQGNTQCANGTAGDKNPTTLVNVTSTGTGSTGTTDPTGSTSSTGSSGSTGTDASSGGSGSSSSSGGTSSGTTSSSGSGSSTGSGSSSSGSSGSAGSPGSSGSTGSTGSSGATASSGGTSSSGAAVTCDPSTGECSGGSASTGSGSSSDPSSSDPSSGDASSIGSGSSGSSGTSASSEGNGGGGTLTASPTTLAVKKGWSSSQSLMVLVVLLVAGLVVAPGLTAHLLRRREEL